MHIMPYKSFQIKTDLQPGQVHSMLLSKSDANGRGFLGFKTDKTFCGNVSLTDFELMLVIQYKNSANPVITGEIKPTGSGSEINVTMRLSKIVRVFLVCFCICAIIIALTGTIISVLSGQTEPLFLLLPICLVLILGACLISCFGFYHGAKEAEEEFRSMFGNDI